MSTAHKFKTLKGPSSAEFRDRGSRFLCFVYPVESLEEVKSIVKRTKSEHPKAAHHCVAYRIGHDGTQFRASDDGEPSGSAGRPMLGAIDAAGLTNVLAVVVRYFGGTLLGVPGLIHAYGSSVAQALASGTVIEKWIEKTLRAECDYAALSEVLRNIRTAEGRVISQEQGLFCSLLAAIPEHLTDACTDRLSDLRSVSVSPL